MRYHLDDPYKVLTESGLPYVATERFALDQLLGRQVKNIDQYVVYIRTEDQDRWKGYLRDRATEVDSLANLFLYLRDDDKLFQNGPVVPIEILARDIARMAPRYFTRHHKEISEKAPAFYAKILELYPSDSLNLPDNALKVA